VTIATAVTLFVVPVLYRWLAPGTKSPQAIGRALRALQRTGGSKATAGVDEARGLAEAA